MTQVTTNTIEAKGIKAKLADYIQFSKLRLSLLVVFSAGIGFYMGPRIANTGLDLFNLLVGGFLVVVASNGLNQIIEKDYDKLMLRTNNRPVATGRMSVAEGLFISLACGIIGVFQLSQLNAVSALIGVASLFSYAFLYTPMKRVSPISVLIGAFPGAFPVLIGYTASFGANVEDINWFLGTLLFAVQFFWQFPHFWAIAWILNEDYSRAGFKMLPNSNQTNQRTALQILVYTAALLPASILPSVFGFTGFIYLGVSLIMGIYLLKLAFSLYKQFDIASARKLMFGSFAYLPVVQIACVLDKLI